VARTVADVKAQAADYEQMRAELEPYRQLAHLVVARYFGVDVDERQLRAVVRYLGDGAVGPVQEYQRILAQVQGLAGETHLFHWDLEFPEVFLGQQSQFSEDGAGFDAVIGNPPYVRQEELAPLKPYFAIFYPKVYQGTADLFVYFFGRGLQIVRSGGRLAYISSNSWLRVNYARSLRAVLRTEATVETLVDLGDNRVFAEAPDVYPAIQVVRRQMPPADHTAQAVVFTRSEGLAQFAQQVAIKFFPVTIYDQPDEGWRLEGQGLRSLLHKVMASGTPLGQVADEQIYYGIKTGLNEAFIIDQTTRNQLVHEDPACEVLIKPLVNGEDVRPWFIEDEGRWLIGLPNGWTRTTLGKGLSETQAWAKLEERHPAIAKHLASFADKARQRADQGEHWWELRPCDYYDRFDNAKLFWPEMSKYPRFALARPGIVGNKTTFMIPGENSYLLGILMSRVTWFAITGLCQPIGERGGMLRYTLSAQFMRLLPIPDTPEGERVIITDQARQISNHAQTRYTLQYQARQRIFADLGTPGTMLNEKLTRWWGLGFAAFRAQVRKALRHEIPEREWPEWDSWLAGQRAEHERLTAEIVRLETELNDRVYSLFDLTPSEVRIIEESTKYRYGEM
jgi:hypothetical protein